MNYRRHGNIITILTVVIGLGLIIGVTTFSYNSNTKEINNWAHSHNYTILDKEAKFFNYGPFYYCSKGQTVYKITVRVSTGEEKTFYCRTWDLYRSTEFIEYNK